MKKYIIKDSQGNKKTIYAENITHAIKLNDAFNLKPGDAYLIRSDETTVYKVLKIDNTDKGFNSINVTTEAYKYNIFSGKIERESGASNHSLNRNDIDTVFSSMNEAIKYLQRKAKQYEPFSKKMRKDSIKDVDISFDKRIKKAVERGKLNDFAFNGLYAMKASKAEFPELKQELEKRNYKNIMFSNNPYNRYNVFFKDEASLAEIDEAIDNIADKYGGFYSRTYDKVFKDLKTKYPNLKYEDVRRAIINYAENSSSANAQLKAAKKYFSDSVNDSRVRDEASSVTTINALVNDEKAAIDSYDVAIKNLEEKIDEKAMQVLINIRNDERRHIENLYSILNGQVTEKNLEDSRMKDSKYYVGISTHGYTKEQAERDARKFGLQLKIVGKSRDPHFEYDAYFIGPRNNILKMLKANDLEEFEEDIEDSVHDASYKKENDVYYKFERGYWRVFSIYNRIKMNATDVFNLARKLNVDAQKYQGASYIRIDDRGYYSDYTVKGKDKNAVIRFCETLNPNVKPLTFEE